MAAARSSRPRWGARYWFSQSLLTALALWACAPVVSGRALANGAFPDSNGILLPADRTNEILLTTNFGVISSEDSGQSWSWSCEQDLSSLANLYQLGASPMDRLFALSSSGLIFSDDGSCGWTMAGGTAGNALVTDFFPDPSNPNHVLAVALPNTKDLEAEVIYPSNDGGATFGNPLFTAPIAGGLTGIEIARSDPRIVYAAMYETPGIHPRVVKSTDGGATWAMPIDVEADIGPNSYRIIAIDPVNPQKIYLRVQEALLESLAISEDGGMTFKKPVTFAVMMGAFARLASGTLLVAGFKYDNQGAMTPVGYRSADGGHTFTAWDNIPSLRALAERDGKLYASADNFKDPFALGVSTDEGLTFTPLMKYDQVSSIKDCAQKTCAQSCATQVMSKLWPMSVCAPSKASGCSYERPWERSSGKGLFFFSVAGVFLLTARARRRRAMGVAAPLDRPPSAG